MTTKEELKKQLENLGLRRGMDLLVHSSLRRIGEIEGGADGIIDTLLDILGPEGTLMMSTVSGQITPSQPVFHVKLTPSSVGTLSNVMLRRKGVLRSLHPVHSICALGPKAAFYTDGHLECATPWSPDSPYGKLMRNGGFILFLGTNFSANTCLHVLEIEARVPGLHTKSTTTLYVYDAEERVHTVEHHWHAPKREFYNDLEQIVKDAGGLRYGVTGCGISRFVDAVKLREVLLPLFRTTPELAIVKTTDSNFIWE